MVPSFIRQLPYMQVTNIGPTMQFHLHVLHGNIGEDIHFNIKLNRNALVLITAGTIIFVNKIMQNSIDFPSHTLFGREYNWGQCNAHGLL